jgi:hypothetical protein
MIANGAVKPIIAGHLIQNGISASPPHTLIQGAWVVVVAVYRDARANTLGTRVILCAWVIVVARSIVEHRLAGECLGVAKIVCAYIAVITNRHPRQTTCVVFYVVITTSYRIAGI